MTRVVFMGTPEFSVPSLAALVDQGYDVAAVVTQPDRPSGRGRKLEMSAVKRFALEHGLAVWQPPSLRAPEAVAALAEVAPELIVVAAFGQILRPAVLDLPAHGCINVHASLLPRWRGAAPVQAAILAGDRVTGSTIMRMDVGMDTGPILAQAALDIADADTGGTLTEKLARHGADLLVETLPRWLAGEIEARPQDPALATVCRPLRKEQGTIDWSHPAEEIVRAVRAFNPWPAATTTWNGAGFRVLHARVDDGPASNLPPGTVFARAGRILVSSGAGALCLERVQLAGRSVMSAHDFVLGQPGLAGSRLGEG